MEEELERVLERSRNSMKREIVLEREKKEHLQEIRLLGDRNSELDAHNDDLQRKLENVEGRLGVALRELNILRLKTDSAASGSRESIEEEGEENSAAGKMKFRGDLSGLELRFSDAEEGEASSYRGTHGGPRSRAKK